MNEDYLMSGNKTMSTGTIGVRHVSPERREWIKKESEAILAKNILVREKTKEEMFLKRLENEKLVQIANDTRKKRWEVKTSKSPFAVNLLAEDERIYEETQLRLKEEKERRERLKKEKEAIKNDIIIKAMGEFSDLELLRKERKAILDEEQRLKSLLSLEKVTVNGKADRLVAERALKQRKEAKFQHRRDKYQDSLDRIMQEEKTALQKKMNYYPEQQFLV